MINIRNGIYETNSSSTHSLSFIKENFSQWILDAFEQFHKTYPEDYIQLEFDFETDKHGFEYVVAKFKMAVE